MLTDPQCEYREVIQFTSWKDVRVDRGKMPMLLGGGDVIIKLIARNRANAFTDEGVWELGRRMYAYELGQMFRIRKDSA